MPAISDDGTKQWDPNGGPAGTGAWVPIGNAASTQAPVYTKPGDAATPLPPPQTPTTQQQAGAWGHTGDSIGPDGMPIAGTNGMAIDRDRYRSLGGNPLYKDGPQIDRTASGETRGMNMGALGLLASRAAGDETQAQALARQQTTGAVNGLTSGAASMKGGAMARAAAARGAVATGARVQGQGNEDVQALRAREMADAAGQYFGAATGQRGADLGLATSQAGLNQGQRGANDQREGFYEGIAQDTQRANLDHQLGRSEADIAASQASANNNNARDAAARASSQQAQNTLLGGVNGLVTSANNANNQDKVRPPDGTTTSDPRTKQDIEDLLSPPPAPARRPVSDKEASRLRKAAGDIASNTSAQRQGAGLSSTDTPGNQSAARGEAETASKRVRDRGKGDPRDHETGYDRSIFRQPLEQGIGKEALDAQIAKRIEEDHPAKYGYFDEAKGGSVAPVKIAPTNYANSRSGQAGYMFGSAPKASYGNLRHDLDLSEDQNAKQDFLPHPQMAPGSLDTFGEHHALSRRDRDISMSDPAAKREAFIAGVNHATDAANTGTFGAVPDYVETKRPSTVKSNGPATDRRAASATDSRADRTAQSAANKSAGWELAKADMASMPGMGGTLNGAGAIRRNEIADEQQMRANAKKVARPVHVDPQSFVRDNPAPVGDPERTRVQPPATDRKVGNDSFERGERDDRPDWRKYVNHTLFGVPNMEGESASEATTSDPRSKENAEHIGNPMAQANRSMSPSSYEYKPEFAEAEGQQPGEKNVGPMADRMEADPVARTAIVTDPETGLRGIDKTKGLKLVMGGLASLQQQVDQMGGRR